eukprot:SAG22_NODE_18191_length_291_cov_0.984375_1_plen_46_part_10
MPAHALHGTLRTARSARAAWLQLAPAAHNLYHTSTRHGGVGARGDR